MIQNPIFKGFNPDPCICRKGEDFYCAVSTFEWLPGVPVYHSKDLKNWELLTNILTDEQIDLGRFPSAQGIWAPDLSYCEEEDLFYLVYGIMKPNGMNIDNFLITAPDMMGPWSEPVYLQSSGFDASIFHGEDGRKYILSLEWERRAGYYRPGEICMAEYSPKEKRLLDFPKRIWRGSTKRGWVEGPHLYQRDGKFYLLCAEGGTQQNNHCVTMARADQIWGPYEADPENPILSSRLNSQMAEPTKYNPDILLQRSGHGSLVDTPNGKTYMVHLCSRPLLPEVRSTLGRESAIQEMTWTEDGWYRKKNGSPLPESQVAESGLPLVEMPQLPVRDEFDQPTLGNFYYAPHYMPKTFADTTTRKGYISLRGQETLDSFDKISLLARKITSVNMQINTKMEFTPKVHQHSAGLALYYDNLNYVFLRKYYSETLGQSALSILHSEKGEYRELMETRVGVSDQPLYLRLVIDDHRTYFEWSYDGADFTKIGPDFDTTHFSDEFCGEFNGTMAGLACIDGVFRRQVAAFDYFEMIDLS